MDIQLKPCPFCGDNNPVTITDKPFKYIMCNNCKASSGNVVYNETDNMDERIVELSKLWNRRM